jgi:hypothetical protein
MTKNNKTQLKSMRTIESCLECRCGTRIDYSGSAKAKIMMRLHNKVCPFQVRGHYKVENVEAHLKVICHK